MEQLNVVLLVALAAVALVAVAVALRLARRSAVLELVPAPIWRRRPDLEIDWANLARHTVLGADHDESGRAVAARALRSGRAQSESRSVVVDGRRRIFDITEIPDGRGGTLGWARDVTALESVQAEMERHIAAHEEVLEALSVGISIYGPDRRLAFHNRAFAAIWGIDRTLLDSRPTIGQLLEILRGQRRLPETIDFKAFRQERESLFQTLIEPREDMLHLPDGQTIRVKAMPHPFGGVLFISEDVSDRLALERSFNTLIAVQRETLDNMFEGVAMVGGDGRLRLSNPAFAALWGISPQDLVPPPHVGALAVLLAARLEHDDHDLASLLAMHEARTGDLALADGRRLRFAALPLPEGAMLFSYLDISDTFRAEKALLERNAALETADRLKSRFMASISYELRTPLTAIVGFSELLAGGYVGPMTPRQSDYAASIREASQRLMTLIDDILDLTAIESGQIQVMTAAVDVADAVNAVVQISQERALRRHVTVEVGLPDGLPKVLGDEKRLKQAIFNLLDEAIGFSASDSTVRIEARQEEGKVLVTLSTGAPLGPAAAMPRGRGIPRPVDHDLGLILVQRLLGLHGGSLSLEALPGRGVVVTCHLPVAPPAAAAQP
ncbi:MAG: PAS domain-containing sensor histidine kinase [Thalassobaculales bacterium]